jgi:adenosylcobalamin-dependent ribonucleoside-triphosphate reductase
MQDWLSFKLPDAFVDSYAKTAPAWGFPIGGGNSLGELTYISKYSRKKDEAIGYEPSHPDYDRKERWFETCRRCIEGMYTILKDHCAANRTPWNEQKSQRSAQAAYDRMFNFKWLPPGRGLANMGTIMVHGENNSATLLNCFSGDESFLTLEYGPVTFIEVVGEEVTVWTPEGWVKAPVSSFGEQSLQRVTFAPAMPGLGGFRKARSNVRVDVKVTPDHRWVLEDGTETTDLKVGDTILSVPTSVTEDDEYWAGFAHGLIFGDGSKIQHEYTNGDYGFSLRACDERTKNVLDSNPELVKQFDSINHGIPSFNGDPLCHKRSQSDLKAFPLSHDLSYNQGFLSGWITADANYTADGDRIPDKVILTSQHLGASAWLREWSAYSGWILTGTNADSVMTTNFGVRHAPCYRYTLRRDTVHFKVENIEELPELEEVFCVTVPSAASFRLGSGLHTGNCAFVSTGKVSSRSVREATLPFERIMEMSMNGVGVGFDVRGAGKLTIHKPGIIVDTHVIEDTREAWAQSLSVLLESYFFENRNTVEFDYSKIRPLGTPLKRFGGTASGPDPLKYMHDTIRFLFEGRAGQTVTETDITDIGNLAGKAAVAGGARRSAEIVLGPSDSEEFINLKNKSINPVRNGLLVDAEGKILLDDDGQPKYSEDGGWAQLSNNSVIAEVGGDYSHLVESIATNGEPGLVYLDLIREYGRLGDEPNNRDHRVMGVNPCSEQSLEHMELCTLVETFPFHHDDYEDYRETLKAAYLYAKSVTLMPTIWPESNEVMQRNRRIGTSISGVAQFVETHGIHKLKSWLTKGYDFICYRDMIYSEWLGVRESIKKSSVKPSGTVSILCGATPGEHWPEFVTYVRRIRFMKSDPMVALIEAAGYHVEPDVMDPKNTVVAEFPALGPDVRNVIDVSVWEKTHMTAMLQRDWADNQVSATLSFRQDEKDQIGPIIANFDGQLKSMSFLPILEDSTSYAQMPYEARAREEIEMMQKGIKKINLRPIYDTKKGQQAEGEKYCTNDTCII